MPEPPRPGTPLSPPWRDSRHQWDFLSDFQDRGTAAIDDFLATAAQSKWGVASNGEHPRRGPHPGDGGQVPT